MKSRVGIRVSCALCLVLSLYIITANATTIQLTISEFFSAEKSALPEMNLIPGGHSLGVTIETSEGARTEIGTLTFYDPITNRYGGFGHPITNTEHKKADIKGGDIIESSIQAVIKGLKENSPGEKVGSLSNDSTFYGTVDINKDYGIYGMVNYWVDHTDYPETLPVAKKEKVKEGPAKIYTVIKNNEVEQFDIQITKIMSYRSDGRNMVIEITDPRLLALSGGIVYGMSGSPIIQDNHIVGALSYVFLDDNRKGYGVFIENMIKESGILESAKFISNKNSLFYLELRSDGSFYLLKDLAYAGNYVIDGETITFTLPSGLSLKGIIKNNILIDPDGDEWLKCSRL